MAAYEFSRGTKYSVCNSLPALGVNPILKCGSRSCQGPGTPICGVQFSAESVGMGCMSFVAADAPNQSFRPPNEGPSPTLLLTQTSPIFPFRQSVKRLTL